jgi:hypothetical protein
LFFALACGLAAGSARAQLKAGDIAVVAFNTDGGDEFAWVALRRLPAHTQVCFTDSSVSNGCFRWTEHLGDTVGTPGPLTWTFTNALPAGTVVTWTSNVVFEWSVGEQAGGHLNLSYDGDQIFVYSGAITECAGDPSVWRGVMDKATMIFGLNFANGGWNNVSGGSTTTSYVPPGLFTNLGTAVHVDAKDNGYYVGIRTGKVDKLLQAIAVPANWTTGNDPFTSNQWPTAFTVLPEASGTVFTFH